MHTPLIRATSFISFYVGQFCHDGDNLPASLSINNMMEGLSGLLDTCEHLAQKFIELKGEAFFIEEDDTEDKDAILVDWINKELNLFPETKTNIEYIQQRAQALAEAANLLSSAMNKDDFSADFVMENYPFDDTSIYDIANKINIWNNSVQNWEPSKEVSRINKIYLHAVNTIIDEFESPAGLEAFRPSTMFLKPMFQTDDIQNSAEIKDLIETYGIHILQDDYLLLSAEFLQKLDDICTDSDSTENTLYWLNNLKARVIKDEFAYKPEPTTQDKATAVPEDEQPNQENFDELIQFMTAFEKAFDMLDDYWMKQTASNEFAAILERKYPFSTCFHELTIDVKRWSEFVREEAKTVKLFN
jgi:hypothetical protein